MKPRILNSSITCYQQKHLYWLFFLCFVSSTLFAQTAPSIPCGFEVDEEMLIKLQNHRAGLKYWENEYQQRKHTRTNEQILLPIVFHIVQNNNGDGATDLATIDQALLQLNSAFASSNFQFEIKDVNSFQDQIFYLKGDDGESFKAIIDNMQPSVINIFVVSKIETGAIAYATFGEQMVIEEHFLIDDFKKNILAHEIGHYFGLFHTHGKFGLNQDQCVAFSEYYTTPSDIPIEVFCAGAVRFDNGGDTNNDGIVDCEQTGDHICDTPTSPVLSNQVDANCNYVDRTTTGILLDYYGDAYEPYVDNIMSYSSNYRANVDCSTTFTNGQLARMYASLMEFNQDLLCPMGEISESRVIVVDNLLDECMGSLQWAISVANTRKGVDTIVFEKALFVTAQTIGIQTELGIGGDVVLIGHDSLTITGQDPEPGFERTLTTSIAIEGDNVTLKNLNITNMGSTGISIENSKQVSISFCNIQENGASGIYIKSNCSDVQIVNSELADNFYGIRVDSSSQVAIRNCLLQNNEVSGIFLTKRCSNVEITDCDVKNNTFHGIESNNSEVTIKDCIVQNNVNIGVALFNAYNTRIDNVDISNNERGIYALNSSNSVINGVNVLQHAAFGIRMDSSTQIAILDCNIQENEGNGIFFTNKCRDVEVLDSEVRNNNFHGISISESEAVVKNSIVEGNKNIGVGLFNAGVSNIDSSDIRNNGIGLFATNSRNTSLNGMSIMENASFGIEIDSSVQVSILDCRIEGNDKNGVYIRNKSKRVAIADSKVISNGFHGIVIDESEVLIKHNDVQKNANVGIALFDALNVSIDTTNTSNNDKGVYVFNSMNISMNGLNSTQNGSYGLSLVSSNQVSMLDCTVIENNDNGIVLNKGCKDIQIMDSEIGNNTLNGILIGNSEASVQSSTIFCNGSDQINTNNERLVANIQGLTNNGIVGNAIPNSQIYIYRNKDNCTSCDAAELIGNTVADAQGIWKYTSKELRDSLQYSLTTISVLNGNTSPLSDCVRLGDLTTSSIDRLQTAPFQIKVKANPIQEELVVYLESTTINTPLNAQLFTSNGQQVSSFVVPINSWFSHGVAELPNGVYMLQISENNRFQTIKIIKQ